MKAFEEWFWNKYDPHDDSYDIDSIMKTKAGWKAALKWALAQATDLQATELEDAIRKELEG